MTYALVVGATLTAKNLTRILLCSGVRVTMLGAGQGVKEDLQRLVRDHVENVQPFMFVDDLRDQEQKIAGSISRLSVSSIKQLPERANVIIDAGENENLLREITRKMPSVPVATVSEQPAHPSHIQLHLYEPIENTQMCQLHGVITTRSIENLVRKRQLPPYETPVMLQHKIEQKLNKVVSSGGVPSTSLVSLRLLLKEAGITEIDSDQALVADRLISSYNKDDDEDRSRLASILSTVIPSRMVQDNKTTLMH